MAKRKSRPRLGGAGRKKKQYLRKPYSYEFKLNMINHFRQSKSVKETMEHFFPEIEFPQQSEKRKLMYKWEKQRETIELCVANASQAGQCTMREVGTATVLPAEVETALVEWINDYRRDGVPVSAQILRLKALEVAQDGGIPRSDFAASYQWRRRLLKRHRLSFRARTHQGQTPPPEAMVRVIEFAKEVRRRAVAEDVTANYSADQTGVFFEVLPRTATSPTGASTVWAKCGKKEKERMTAMLLGDMSGGKYPLFLVLKSAPAAQPETRAANTQLRHGFGRYVWKEVEPLQKKYKVQIYANKSAWWNGALTIEFLRFYFGDRHLFGPTVMLLLDDFSRHWVPEVGEYAVSINIVLVKVPPGLTWLCQPADVVWVKPLKDRLRKFWVRHLQEQLREHRDGSTDTSFAMKAPTRETVVKWESEVWDDIPARVVSAGFRKCMLDESTPAGEPQDEVECSELQITVDDVLTQLKKLSVVDVTSKSTLTDKDDVVDSVTIEVDEETDE